MTRQQDNSVLYAVYGTLRKGCGNHRVIEKAEFLGEIKTPAKFTMHTFGSFPAVVEQGNNQIVVEVYRTSDEEVIKGVNRLENYTGKRGSADNWYDTCDIDTPWGTANLFTMNEINKNGGRKALPIISSGDWKNQ